MELLVIAVPISQSVCQHLVWCKKLCSQLFSCIFYLQLFIIHDSCGSSCWCKNQSTESRYGLIDAFYLYYDRSLQFSIDDYVNDMHQSSCTDFSQQWGTHWIKLHQNLLLHCKGLGVMSDSFSSNMHLCKKKLSKKEKITKFGWIVKQWNLQAPKFSKHKFNEAGLGIKRSERWYFH